MLLYCSLLVNVYRVGLTFCSRIESPSRLRSVWSCSSLGRLLLIEPNMLLGFASDRKRYSLFHMPKRELRGMGVYVDVNNGIDFGDPRIRCK